MLVDLEKANKVAVRMAEKVPQDAKDPLLAELRKKFGAVIDQSVMLEAEIAYVTKARKGKSGETLSFAQLQQKCEKAAVQINSLNTLAKSMRSA